MWGVLAASARGTLRGALGLFLPPTRQRSWEVDRAGQSREQWPHLHVQGAYLPAEPSCCSNWVKLPQHLQTLEREQRGPAEQGDVTLCSCGDSLIRLDSSELFQSLCGHDPGAKALGRLPGLLRVWFQFLFSSAAQVSR